MPLNSTLLELTFDLTKCGGKKLNIEILLEFSQLIVAQVKLLHARPASLSQCQLSPSYSLHFLFEPGKQRMMAST